MPLTTSGVEFNARAQGRSGAEKEQMGASRFASLRLGVFALKGGGRDWPFSLTSILSQRERARGEGERLQSHDCLIHLSWLCRLLPHQSTRSAQDRPGRCSICEDPNKLPTTLPPPTSSPRNPNKNVQRALEARFRSKRHHRRIFEAYCLMFHKVQSNRP